jgi:WD40 repeat protein
MATLAAASGAALSPDNQTLATIGDDSRVTTLWTYSDRTHLTKLGDVHGYGPPAFSPDGRLLATSDDLESTVLWNITNPANPTEVKVFPAAPPVLFSADSRLLASKGGVLWNIADPSHPTQWNYSLGDVTAEAISADRRTLVTLGSDTSGTDQPADLNKPGVHLWDITDPAHPAHLSFIGGPGTRAVLATDGVTLVTGDPNGVTVWDITDRAHPRVESAPLAGHFNTFGIGLALHTETQMLAVAGERDQGPSLWDLTGRTHPGRLPGPDSGDTATFSRNGRTLVTSVEPTHNGSPSVTLWDLTALQNLRQNFITIACQITEGGLNQQEWASFAPAVDYRPTCPNG